MFTGLLLTLLNSVVLAGLAATFQRAARRELAVLPFCALVSVFAFALSLPMVHWGALLNGSVGGLAALTAVMFASGITNAGAFGCNIAAMRRGHSAVTFAVTQSAMAITFLFALVGWGERASVFQMGGLVCVIAMLGLVAPRSETPEQPATAKSGWFVLVLVALVLGGVTQVLYITPSRWAGWQDVARVRVPLFMAAMAATFIAPAAVLRQGLKREMVPLAGLTALLLTANLFVLLMAIDRLAPLQLAGLVYPVTVAGGLLLYCLYSHIWLREVSVARQWWGMGAGVAGIALLCVR